jgi:tetratricopeptide (TPR) repeat protein
VARASRSPFLFVSSTSIDLAEFRDVARHVASRLGMSVTAMEEFGPDPRRAAEVCREKVLDSDLFLGLYAHRYGHQAKEFDDKSLTELEYMWAVEAGHPVLLYVIDDEIPWPPKFVDRGDAAIRLDRFKAVLRDRHVVSALTTPERLKEDLFVHLPAFRDRTADIGSDTVPVVLPSPPRPFIAHWYTLLQTTQVIGRARELSHLDRWVGDPQDDRFTARVFCIVAIGGMGKSALAWKWFHERAAAAMRPLGGRVWWSFYDTDADFDRFVTSTLAYLSQRPLEAVAALSAADRDDELIRRLDGGSYLLVLDGYERLQIAYATLNTRELADDDLDARTANRIAGERHLPPSAEDSFTGQHRLRKAIEPRVGSFLRKLTQVRASRILITTRLFPSELQTVTGAELAGSAALFLTGLSSEDALALWRDMKVSGGNEELERLFARFDRYPLLIRALAGEVARFRRAPGDFDAWKRARPDFDPFSLSLVQVKSHVLERSLGGLSDQQRDLLNALAACRAPTDYGTLSALFTEGKGWSADTLDNCLTEVEERGLVGWDRKSNRYDLHPVVRGVVWAMADDRTREGAYRSLEAHFSALPVSDAAITSMADAAPVLELFNALVGLGQHPAAAKLYFERLHPQALRLGVPIDTVLFESLFPDGVHNPPRVAPRDVSAVLAQLGHAYVAVGRLGDAEALYRRREESDTRPSLSFSFLSNVTFLAGRLREALEFGQEALHAEHDSPVSALTSLRRVDLAALEGAMGRLSAAHAHLASIDQADSQKAWVRVCQAQLSIWEGDPTDAVEHCRSALADDDLALFTQIAAIRTLGDALMQVGDLPAAEPVLLDALKLGRSETRLSEELRALVLLAELHVRARDFEQSRARLDDVWDAAQRGPFRLIQADALYVLARLELGLGRRAAGVHAAQQAFVHAWCDGPPYAYSWTLERARNVLRQMGEPEPRPG